MEIEKSNQVSIAAAQFQVNQTIQQIQTAPQSVKYSDTVSLSEKGKKLAAGGNDSPTTAPTYQLQGIKNTDVQQVIDSLSQADRRQIGELNGKIQNISQNPVLSSEKKTEFIKVLNEAKQELNKQANTQQANKYTPRIE